MRILKSLCRFKMCPDVKDSLVVKYLTFVKSCIQKVNLFIRYFSHKFNCLFARAMNSSISFLSVLHNQKILSMYLFHSRGLVFLRFSISVSTADIRMLAKVTAIFVPIGVPCVWRQFLLLNSNDRVLLKNKFKDSSEDWVGIGVFSPQKVWYALHTVFIPSSCGIFVHRLATSKETRKASSGRFLLSMKLTKSVVSLRQDFCDLAMS